MSPGPGATDRDREFHELFAAERIRGQLDFYKARRQEYEKADRQAIVVRNTLLVAAAAAGLVGQAFGEDGRAGWAVVAAILAALAAALTAYASLIGFPQLEKLYADAVKNLEEAEVDWIVADPAGSLTNEVERVEGIFQREIGQWGQLIVKEAPVVAEPPLEPRTPPEPPPHH